MIAKRGDTLQPINSPTSCKYNFVLYVKYVLLNTVSSILCRSTNLSPRRLRECLYSLAMAIMSSMHASMLRLVYKAEISALQKFLFSISTGFNDDNLSKYSWVLLRCVGTWLSNGVSMCVTNHANFSVGLPQHDTMGRTLQCCKISTLTFVLIEYAKHRDIITTVYCYISTCVS